MPIRCFRLVPAAILALAGCNNDPGSASQGGSGSGGSITLTRNDAVGKKYAAPGPRTCSPRNVPESGPPSAAQAEAYTICAIEGEWASNLYLVDQVTVTAVGSGRTYERNQGSRPNIDVMKPVYAIKGSYEKYQCDPTYGEARSGDCVITHHRNAVGDCYLDTFSEWHCIMTDGYAVPNEVPSAPPPRA